ncbi:polysaccharide pyruvyl transferase family protein [Aequorivita sinensis]|uniref:polysaccharide pyruvyl transferase family protein n=1 Tax=Aequorivita sinensis TaxID=1382458 RepID=UPI00111FE446|nr:polysaccharide pyruvyl transferase family protein [Aequorivita sinensis]
MQKRKIAILTQPLKNNYGGIIQNYAMQKLLVDRGYNTVTINRRKGDTRSKPIILASKFKAFFKKYVLQQKTPTYLDYDKIAENNLRFIKKYINWSPLIESTDGLADFINKENFNGVVVGSDQVWRPIYSPNIYNFFLDFLQNDKSIKKVAYAASFGTEEWEYNEEQTNVCSKLIQQFQGVSVREMSGIKLCHDNLNIGGVIAVLDPTMLLSADDYSELIGQRKKQIELFTYVLDDSDEKNNFIKNCSINLNLKHHTNQAKFKITSSKGKKLEDYIIPPIEGWLQGFRDAEFVITDSFHGTVFSILNQKPFITIVNKGRGAARFESILTQLGLEDRLVYDVKNFDNSKLEYKIDYISVNSKLNVLRKASKDFLNNYF